MLPSQAQTKLELGLGIERLRIGEGWAVDEWNVIRGREHQPSDCWESLRASEEVEATMY